LKPHPHRAACHIRLVGYEDEENLSLRSLAAFLISAAQSLSHEKWALENDLFKGEQLKSPIST